LIVGKRRIAQAAGLVMVLFVTSRALGLVREMIIGARFGTSAELDAYLAAFRLPDLLFQLIAGGALGSAFIPTFASYLAREDRAGAWRLASAVANLVLVFFSSIAALAALLAPLLVRHIIAPGFPPAQQALTADLMRWMLISSVIFGVSGLVMGTLNAFQHFLLPALAPVMYNLGIIAGALLLAPVWGVHGLVVGVVVGAAGHLLVQLPGLLRFHARYMPVLDIHDPGVQEVIRLMAPRVLGLAAVQLNFLVNTILASGLPEGSLAALNYAWLLMLLPQGIFAQAIATATFPTFAAQFARGRRDTMRDTLGSSLRAVLFLTLPAAVGLIVLREPFIRLLLERGAFDERSTVAVAWALRFFALGLPAHAVVEITARAFYAMHDTRTPVMVGLGAMLLNVLLSLLLISPMAHGGLALANSIATTLEMTFLVLLLRRRLEGIAGQKVARGVILSGTATLILWATLRGLARRLPNTSPWALGFGGAVLGATTYGAAAYLLGMEELQMLTQLLLTRLRQRSPERKLL